MNNTIEKRGSLIILCAKREAIIDLDQRCKTEDARPTAVPSLPTQHITRHQYELSNARERNWFSGQRCVYQESWILTGESLTGEIQGGHHHAMSL